MPYSFNAKCAFVTYPRCSTEKEVVLGRAIEQWPDLDWMVIAREIHKPQELTNQDGPNKENLPSGNRSSTLERTSDLLTPFHLHVLICWKSRKHSRDPSWLDFLAGAHPNIQTPRSRKTVMEYITKEDTDALEFPIGTIAAVIAKSAGISVLVSQMIRDHKSLREIDLAAPGFVLLHKPQIDRYVDMVRLEELSAAPVTRRCLTTSSKDTEVIKIVEWFADAILTGTARKPKEVQLWICAPPNFGKSLVFDLLAASYRVYVPAMNSDFWPGYSDTTCDFIIWDEFHGSHIQLALLNRILEGRAVRLKIYCGQVIKMATIPCVIMSNLSPLECYSKAHPDVLAALCTRLLVVNPSEPFGLSMKMV